MTAGFAQQSEPETGEINPGTAKATALVARIGPGVGNLELAMRGGIAVTQVTNALGQATSQTLDLGLIGTSLTAESCDNAILDASQLPQPTSVDNRGGDAQLDEDESQSADQPFGVGRKSVRSTADPVSSTAITTTAGIDLAPALRVAAGRAESVTRVLPGEGREAHAQVESSIDLAGLVTLSGLHWNAYHRTGVDPHAEASFTIGRASLGGLPIPTGDLGAAEEVLNEALAPLGVTVTLPQVQRILDPADLIRISPLRIEIRDSPAGKTIFGPVLNASREQRGELFDLLSEQICQAASVLLVGDVVVSILSGTGFLTLEIGGAEAASSDLEITSPFGAAIPPGGDVGAVPPPAVSSGPSIGAGPASPVTAAPPAPPPTTNRAEQALPVTSRSGPLEEFCESVHPNGDDCSEGAALALGLLALAGTVGVAGTDLLRQRQARGKDVPS